MIFSVLKENRLSIKALMGNFKITVSKEENFFRPVEKKIVVIIIDVKKLIFTLCGAMSN